MLAVKPSVVLYTKKYKENYPELQERAKKSHAQVQAKAVQAKTEQDNIIRERNNIKAIQQKLAMQRIAKTLQDSVSPSQELNHVKLIQEKLAKTLNQNLSDEQKHAKLIQQKLGKAIQEELSHERNHAKLIQQRLAKAVQESLLKAKRARTSPPVCEMIRKKKKEKPQVAVVQRQVHGNTVFGVFTISVSMKNIFESVLYSKRIILYP
ncbi:unnamed protein product [Owenia fusiformis]|uniref:Uncharacterized protein n=1 Tax=Owenia fusiformis TaxID=6347 RepID=A0A8S4P4S2_OWEFU|nr:unnamed protein product [Owenia fusiformis]